MDLSLHPDVVDDIRALPDDAARKVAVQTIAHVRLGRRTGVPLDYRARTGDLRDCRKVHFDVPGRQQKPRFRLVYRVIDETTVEVLAAEVLAVGLRVDLSAYHDAAHRAGRHPDDRAPTEQVTGRSGTTGR
ncbi:MAG TPA: hypothetical protein VGC57_13085 [Cellulomonas sp.]